MILTAINAGRRLVSRGRGASDEIGDSLREIGSSVDELLGSADRALAQFTDGPRTRKAPIVIAGLAAALGGYLLGRRAASSGPASSFGEVSNSSAPDVTAASTAVASSRPQPAEAESAASANRASAKTNGEAKAPASGSTKAKSAGSTKAKSTGTAAAQAKKSTPSSRSTKAAPKGDQPSKS